MVGGSRSQNLMANRMNSQHLMINEKHPTKVRGKEFSVSMNICHFSSRTQLDKRTVNLYGLRTIVMGAGYNGVYLSSVNR